MFVFILFEIVSETFASQETLAGVRFCLPSLISFSLSFMFYNFFNYYSSATTSTATAAATAEDAAATATTTAAADGTSAAAQTFTYEPTGKNNFSINYLEYVRFPLWAAALSSHISCSCDGFFFAN